MTYDSAQSLHFQFDVDYEPICGACIEFRLGDFSQVCEIWRPASGQINFDVTETLPASLDFTFQDVCYPPLSSEIIPACDEIEPYIHPTGTIDFTFYKTYAAPVGVVDLDLADCAGDIPPEPPPPWYQIPAAISSGISLLFGSADRIDKRVDTSWSGSRVVEPHVGVAFGDSAAIERELDSVWGGLGQLYRSNSMVWDRLLTYDRKVQALWRNLKGRDLSKTCPYGKAAAIDDSVDLLWLSPPEKDQLRSIPFGTLNENDRTDFDVPWGNPPPKDIYHTTCWGPKYYEEICTRDYLPPAANAIDFDLHTAIEDVGDTDHINFWFDSLSYDQRCNHREPSGWRDAYTYRPATLIPAGEVRKYYIMNNIASVTRASDQVAIEAKGVTVATDMDSFCWSLSLTPGSEEAISMLDPSNTGGAVAVEVDINGLINKFQADTWSHGRRFVGPGRQAGGRSLSAELAAPASVTKTFIEGSDRTAQQIATAVLQYTGWTLDWQLTDWLIPGGVFSCDSQTPMQIIQTIAAAAGGYVQTHPTDKILIVAPRYSRMPWDWDTATPDIIIPESMMTSIDGQWTPRPAYNAAFVSGTVTGGISMKVTRNGTAGDVVAPMETDPLLTATEACTARAKMILAKKGGNRKIFRCSLPVMRAPDQPGVLLPGKLISVTGVVPWRAMVLSVSVTAAWARALVVRQTVELERYYGN